MKTLYKTLLASMAISGSQLALASDANVEVMHFWTSGGEAKALSVVKDALDEQGIAWKDSPIAGGGGDNAKTVMRARIFSGNPPTAMLMLGQEIIDWANEGLLTDVNAAAEQGNWDNVLPEAVQTFTKVDGNYVSVPTNIHRVNMVWANKASFEKIGADVPTTWAEFNALADDFRAAGIIPLAHGGQAWQDMTLFDSVVLGIGGQDFYQRLFVEQDLSAIESSTMTQVFDQMRTLSTMVDDNFAGRDWNIATSMVIRGEAAMQVMGDWAKGEFSVAGKQPNEDFLCFASPGTRDHFIFLVNSFSMFEQKDPALKQSQLAMANAIMQPQVQVDFNLAKGAVPARLDTDMNAFDACAKATMSDLQSSSANNTSVPTFAFTHAAGSHVVGAFTDVVTLHFNSPEMSSAEAAEQLKLALQSVL